MTPPSLQRIAILDFETTDLHPERGQIIEGAVILTEIRGQTLDTYWSFNDPGFPIPPAIVKLTGITDDLVQGKLLDWARFHSLLDQADLIISHNAPFDRAWLERWGNYQKPNWGCSLQMIDWARHGMPCRTLKHLAWEHGHFPNAHRAIDDVNTLLLLLKTPSLTDPQITYGEELIRNALLKKHLVFAHQAPFDSKDILKEEKFRWSPEKKVWWKLILETEICAIDQLMKERIYPGPPKHQITEAVDSLTPSFRARYGLTA